MVVQRTSRSAQHSLSRGTSLDVTPGKPLPIPRLPCGSRGNLVRAEYGELKDSRKLYAVTFGSLIVLALSLPVSAQDATQSTTTTTQTPPQTQTTQKSETKTKYKHHHKKSEKTKEKTTTTDVPAQQQTQTTTTTPVVPPQ